MILDYCKLFKIILKCWLFRVLWWAAAWIEWWDRKNRTRWSRHGECQWGGNRSIIRRQPPGKWHLRALCGQYASLPRPIEHNPGFCVFLIKCRPHPIARLLTCPLIGPFILSRTLIELDGFILKRNPRVQFSFKEPTVEWWTAFFLEMT